MEQIKLSSSQRKILCDLAVVSARKGNLANAGLVLQNGKILASAESLVVSDCNASAHSERMLVEMVGHLRHSNYTPGLTMVSVVEPCTMCMSAVSQAGYKYLAYIIPAKRYVEKIPWVTDGIKINKERLASQFSEPLKLVHLSEYEEEFSRVFEREMKRFLA
ncbi:MAG: hypothetical protein UX31_C0012G0014 [Candidatus Nomurabacteria bacterium GW2011_GWA1_46_11]|uniref:CMP/dCMP-type deaminase domain-containing protein n=1 Tax=Candidatus Nomurabacteria bacterium GW2011_GWA1_46_11 TaxID=1618732 RepID=A0A0G1QVE6_9BACT|nr:MAG: hypothetical protein UW69_C0029G0009 [Microgenomates group bacterium GW2011_GWA2_44_7]KKT77953.1 MAG: hypothetical protein UW73_C0009G0052 [Microgenomates group bacterium GW2011_GWB1_44_8]KKU21778.1 MAG: hypothetical protein UX31_C0012G0014 [Candidatus Nomurabacteria bacterium GW2011_GWA1_46_11]